MDPVVPPGYPDLLLFISAPFCSQLNGHWPPWPSAAKHQAKQVDVGLLAGVAAFRLVCLPPAAPAGHSLLGYHGPLHAGIARFTPGCIGAAGVQPPGSC